MCLVDFTKAQKKIRLISIEIEFLLTVNALSQKMEHIYIGYFKEIILNDNNKFTLDFSDEEFVQEIDFLTNRDYYVASLNCNLILKEYINNKKRLVE